MRAARAVLSIGVLLLPLMVRAQDIVLQPTQAAPERMRDIGSQVFGTNYIATYTYSNAVVTLSFNQSGLKYLDGTLTATGLKPNFAYQVKLGGRPLEDPTTNVALGRVGRWWRMTPSPGNSNDTEYEQRKNDPAYSFQGYLPIAFFVTDANGAANVRMLGNNSFHVLWRVDQRPPSSNDGPALEVSVPATTGNSAYDASVAPRTYQLYGEWEPNRALPGQLVMLDGAYNCDIELTEESFHESSTFSGNWTPVLRSQLAFSIPTTFGSGDPVDPNPPPSTLPLTIERLRLSVMRDVAGKDSGTADFFVTFPAGTDLNGMALEVTLQGVTRTFTLSKTGRAGDRSGKIAAKRVKGSNAVRFRIQVSRTDFVFAADPLPAAPVVNVGLLVGTSRYAGEASTLSKGTRRITLQFRLPD